MKKMVGAGIALWMGLAASTAQAAADARPCVTEAEAQSVFLVLAPDAIRAVATKCSASLPADATLRGGLATFVAPYDAASTTAWPQAAPVIAGMAGPDVKGIDPAAMKPMLGAMVGAMAADKIKPTDCPTIERVVDLMAPLPPANAAGLVAFAAASASRGNTGPFSICPAAPPPAVPARK